MPEAEESLFGGFFCILGGEKSLGTWMVKKNDVKGLKGLTCSG